MSFRSSRVGGPDQERPIINRSPWTDNETISELGWQIGPDQWFQKFGVSRGDGCTVFAAGATHLPDSSDVQAYVYAFHGGRGDRAAGPLSRVRT